MIVLSELIKNMRPETSKKVSGPLVSVSFFLNQNSISEISLSLSSEFACHIHSDELNLPLQQMILKWIAAYLSKKPLRETLPLRLSTLSPFSKKGLEAISSIPFGHTASYKTIAEKTGNAKAARAVGMVCHRNPFPLVIPCHRIISSNGTLGGFAVDLAIKKTLLDFERS